jgi:hypothetical protein
MCIEYHAVGLMSDGGDKCEVGVLEVEEKQ